MQIYITIICLLIGKSIWGQVSITGKFENLPANSQKKFIVDVWTDDKWNQSDTFSLNPDFTFSKTLSNIRGQAKLRAWGQNGKWIDFLIIPKDKQPIQIDFGTINFAQMNGIAAICKDKENEAYAPLINAYRAYQTQLDSSLKSATVDLDMRMRSEQKLNEICLETQQKFRGTYAGDLLAKLFYIPQRKEYESYESSYSVTQIDFYKKHLLDKIPLNDSRVLWHYGLIKVLNTYWLNFNKNDSNEMKQYLDKVMSKRKGNDEVDAWLFKTNLMKFVNLKDDAALSYLLTWYSPGCSIDEINTDNSTKTLLNALKNCIVGKKAYPLSLPDSSGKLRSLSEIALKSKLTLLFLWRTDCSHCHEFKPKLQELYNKYKSSGLEVIGILLDYGKSSSHKRMDNFQPTWTQLNIITPEQRQAVIKNYPIPGTPSIIAVDKNFIVKNRMVIRATIDQYLEKEFGK